MLKQQAVKFFKFSTGASLYTWGKNTSSLGYAVPSQTT